MINKTRTIKGMGKGNTLLILYLCCQVTMQQKHELQTSDVKLVYNYQLIDPLILARLQERMLRRY